MFVLTMLPVRIIRLPIVWSKTHHSDNTILFPVQDPHIPPGLPEHIYYHECLKPMSHLLLYSFYQTYQHTALPAKPPDTRKCGTQLLVRVDSYLSRNTFPPRKTGSKHPDAETHTELQ